MRTVLRVAWVVGVALLLAPGVRAGDDPAPAPAPGARLAGGGAPAPPPTKPAPVTAGTTTLEGRVVRAGLGVVARVRVWNLGSEETPARLAAEEASRFGIDFAEPGAVPDATWLPRAAVRRAALALAGPEEATPADAEAASSEDGSFRIVVRGPAAYDRLVVVTSRSGPGAFRHVRGSLVPGGAMLRIPLPPPPQESHPRLTVGVRRSDGTPYAGAVALVPAESRMPAEGTLFAGRPKDDGALFFRGVPDGGWRLRCSDDDGYEALSGTLWVPRAEPFVFVVDEPSHEVRGSVASSAGGAVVGAEVGWDLESAARTASFLAKTGEDGTFRTRLPKRAIAVHASAPGHDGASAEVGADAPTVTLVLRAHALLRGRVVHAATGEAVAGVPVLVAEADPLALSLGPDFVAISGPDGTFAVENARLGPVHLVAYGGGYMSVGLEDLERDGYDPSLVDGASPPEGGFVLRVVPVGRLEGRAVDEDGAGVAGARVSVSQADRMKAMCGNGYRRDPIVRFLPEPGEVLADAGGRFVIEPLRPALLYHVSLSRPGFTSRREGLTLEEGGTTEHAFRLARAPEGETRPHPIVVRVTDADTRGRIAGAEVRILAMEAGELAAVSDAAGVARFPAVVGAQQGVEVSADGYLPESAWAQTSSDRPEAPVEVEVALSAPLPVSGRVIDAAGRPAAGANVFAGPVDGPNDASGRATADGRFVLHGLKRGPVSVTSWLSGAGGLQDHGETVTTAGATDVEVRLRRDTSPSRRFFPPDRPQARFRVVGPDGSPVSTGRFRVLTDRAKPGSYVPDSVFAKGVVEATPDERSPWWVEVYAAERPGGGARLAPSMTPPVAPGAAPTDGEIRCGEGAVLAGRVVSPEGEPVVGAGLFASREPPIAGERRSLTLAQGRTDREGRFRLEGLPAEAVALSFDLPGAWLPPREARYPASKEPVEIVVRQAARPWITVVDPAGRPVVGALLAVGPEGSKPTPSDWDHTTPRTGPKGRCRLGSLDPDRAYVLAVEVPRGDGGTPFLPFSLAGWRPADTTVHLTPPGQLTGQVRTPSGEPIAGARLYVAPVGSAPDVEGSYQLETGEDGRFALKDLQPGPIVLRCRVGTSGPLTSLEVTVPAADLDLRPEPGPTWVLSLEGMPEAPRGRLEVVWTPWQEPSDGTRDAASTRRIPIASPLRFHGLRPHRRYAVWAYAEAEGLVGYLSELSGAGGTGTISMRPQGVITGTVTFADPAEEFAPSYVTLETRGVRRYDFPRRDHAFTLNGLPPGRFPIRAEPMTEAEDGPMPPGAKAPASRAVTVEASPGEVVHIVIPARAR